MIIKHLRYTILALLCLSVAAPAALASPVSIFADSCFDGMQPNGVNPISVTVINSGPSTRGILRVDQQAFGLPSRVYAYPIDLPSGAQKRVIAYPEISSYSNGVKVEFDGPGGGRPIDVKTRGNYYIYYRSTGSSQLIQIGCIGDETGAMLAIRTLPSGTPYAYNSAGNKPTYCDCYCAPEAAPDRASGYSGLTELMIDAGSERLTGDQWDAIREWVVAGGSVILVGGAASLSYLEDSTAAQMSPLSSLHEVALAKFSYPIKSSSIRANNVAVVTGTPRPGTEISLELNGQPIVSTRAYGAGVVTLLGFDPSAEPINSLPNKSTLLQSVVDSSRPVLSQVALSAWTGASGNSQPAFDMPVYSYPGAPEPANTAADPFHVQLPPFFVVAAILAIYFVLAVPVTFLVLRRFKRLEWAWFTTPLLSVLFAGVFYLFTADLYKAGLARRTTGIVTLAANDPGAHFDGYSEMFFPRGGSYDLELAAGERLEEQPQGMTGYGAATNPDQLQTIDVLGGMAAPDYDVGNLSFRRFYYSQGVQLSGPLSADLSFTKQGITGSVVNNTGLDITNCRILTLDPVQYYDVGALDSGATKTITGAAEAGGNSGAGGSATLQTIVSGALSTLPSAVAPDRRVAWLTGEVRPDLFGPQIGKSIGKSGSVVLLASLPISGARATK